MIKVVCPGCGTVFTVDETFTLESKIESELRHLVRMVVNNVTFNQPMCKTANNEYFPTAGSEWRVNNEEDLIKRCSWEMMRIMDTKNKAGCNIKHIEAQLAKEKRQGGVRARSTM